jgi:iron-sulfur cluster repair protein YtfE (RIC family)
MNATRLLESQHRLVLEAIDKLLRRRTGRSRLVNELADALAAHLLIEEEILYPVAWSIQRHAIEHSVEEHDLLAIQIQRILATPRNTRDFEVKVEVLRTLLQHHTHIEEHAVLPAVEQLITSQQSDQLGRRMSRRYDQVLPAGSQEILAVRQTSIECPAPGDILQQGGPEGQQGRRERRRQRRSGQSG